MKKIPGVLLNGLIALSLQGQTTSLPQSEIIYGRKDGMALVMYMQSPAAGTSNGKGIIWVVSAGWTSDFNYVNMFKVLTRSFSDRGYMLFFVMHGSQPKYTVPDAVADITKAVRFIRYHAGDFGIDPLHIGISGASAGGHLSLMMGTIGDDGNLNARDPVERVSSRVQAVACFYPPVDFLNWKSEGDNAAVHSDIKEFQAPLDFTVWNAKTLHYIPVTDSIQRTEMGRQISPLYFVTADDAPALIAHGDEDKLVPLSQSQKMMEKLKQAGVPCQLIIKNGAGHGFWNDLTEYVSQFADWFDVNLK